MIEERGERQLIGFGIVGTGWRSDFFLRIAKLLPEMFQVTGIVSRDPEKGRTYEQQWGIPSFRTTADMLSRMDCSFVVVSVPRTVAPAITLDLVNMGVPVLCETPPALALPEMVAFHEVLGLHSKVQIAEQYAFQPNHAARIALVQSGRLGPISQAQVSVAHDYHGISLIRQYLDLRFENAIIRAEAFETPIVAGPNRQGPPSAEALTTSTQVVSTLRFGDKLAVYDFTGDQYFSWVRSPRTLVRGTRGEINNFTVRYLLDYQTPIEADLRRTYAGHDGNLEGYYLRDILLGSDYLYQNPFVPGRLSDDEIAVATCLLKMQRYVDGGPSFYSVAEASQDHYLALMIQEAVKSGRPIQTQAQVWAREVDRG